VEDVKWMARRWARDLRARGHLPREAHSLAEARALMSKSPPIPFDVVLLDLKLDDGDGADLLPEFDQFEPPPAIVIVSNYYDDLRAQHLAGRCDAVLPKPTTAEVVCTVVEAMHSCAEVDAVGLFCRHFHISGRCEDIVRGVAGGRTNAQMATELGCSRGTISSYWKRVFDRTQLRSQPEVVAAVLQFALQRLRRSRELTHLCSPEMTHRGRCWPR